MSTPVRPLPGTPSIDAYLAELAASLPRGPAARDLLDEARDHLHDAAAAHEAAGACRAVAERKAVCEFGGVAELGPGFRAVTVVSDARRLAVRQLIGALVLGAWVGSVWHLIPLAEIALPTPGLAHPVAITAALTLLCPSLLLLALSRTPWPWQDARWLDWLDRARRVASWLFQLGLPISAAMTAHQLALSLGAAHLWLGAGALGGHLVACLLAPPASARQLLSATGWRR